MPTISIEQLRTTLAPEWKQLDKVSVQGCSDKVRAFLEFLKEYFRIISMQGELDGHQVDMDLLEPGTLNDQVQRFVATGTIYDSSLTGKEVPLGKPVTASEESKELFDKQDITLLDTRPSDYVAAPVDSDSYKVDAEDATLNHTDMDFGEHSSKQTGKVRDNYTLTDKGLFVSVATDRMSANNVKNLGDLPHKGAVLTSLTNYWMDQAESQGLIANHRVKEHKDIDPNVTVAHKVTPLPVEVIVRRYLAGSAYRAYEKGKREFGDSLLADGIAKNAKLNSLVVDPTTKGKDDIPVSDKIAATLVGKEDWGKVKDAALQLFAMAEKVAAEKGLILADTKFEFGRDDSGKLVLIDEVITPDCSRFWPGGKEGYYSAFIRGEDPPSFDKDPIRRWEKARANKSDKLPAEVASQAASNYIKVHDLLTDTRFKPYDGEQEIAERIENNLQSQGLI